MISKYKNKPFIGIAPSEKDRVIRMRKNYAEGIIAAGGIPVVIPQTTDPAGLSTFADELDGIMFSGGADVEPERYGEHVEFDSVETTPDRDAFELAIFDEFFKRKKPIFGICRGIQLINVALGGSLYQHIDGHKQEEPTSEWPRDAFIVPGTRLHAVFGADSVKTNSFHHQAVKVPGRDVVVSAKASDGTTEGIELPESVYPFLMAVQWHPEYFYDKDAHASALFSAFVNACK